MTEYAKTVATLLGAHGIPPEAIATVEMSCVEGLMGDHGVITVGYDQDGRRKVTAQAVLTTVLDAEDMLTDRLRIASLIARGVRAMPDACRPLLPAWIQESPEEARAEDMRRSQFPPRNGFDTLPWAA